MVRSKARIQFAPFTEELAPAVRDFNRRLSRARAPLFPETSISSWLPKKGDQRPYEEHFLGLENGSVRGGYILKYHDVSFGGQTVSVASFRLPISEGVVDASYRLVGPKLVADAVQRERLLFAIGRAEPNEPVTRLLKAMGWTVQPLSFYFKVRNGYRFLRNITLLRRTRLRRLASNLAAFSGAGWLGAKLLDMTLSGNRRLSRSLSIQTVDSFANWSDELWGICKSEYSMAAVRDSATLNLIYPPGDSRFIRLQVSERSRPIGWAVVLDSQLEDHEKFGNLRAGLIMDCLALPQDATKVVHAASSVLEQRGVNFIRSHQSHPRWCEALRQAGFLRGASFFYFSASPAFGEKLDRIDPRRTNVHLNRGDGDGPLHP